MTQTEIIDRLREQAERGDLNARAMLKRYETTTPDERKARAQAAVERYRQRVEASA